MAEMSIPSVSTHRPGFFKPGFHSNEKVVIDITNASPTPGVFAPEDSPPVNIFDARVLQEAEEDRSIDFESKFYRKHGFVLLEHESSVENWDSGVSPIGDALDTGDSRELPPAVDENQIETRYLPEVEQLIRQRLLPDVKLNVEQYPTLLRRGKNTPNPFFGLIVHNDYGRTADDFQENMASFGTHEVADGWRAQYDRPEIAGFMIINFWRTVHMSQPLQHMPLAVLDSSSVEPDDLVSSGLRGFTTTGRITNQLSLRFNADQKWFYYPRMTTSEVLALNLFECYKDEAEPFVRNTYHSAFEEPNPVGDVEERQSCEHRVHVWLLNS